jgi:signal transduction histidine kinase
MTARFFMMKTGAIAQVLCALVFFCTSTVAASEPKRVLLLHSFGRDFKPWSEYARAIRSELQRINSSPLNIYEQSLEIASFQKAPPEGPFVAYLDSVFADQPLDLIISIGAPAADFVQRHRQQLFPEAPMLLTVVDQRRVQYSKLIKNDAVVAVAINYYAAIENILRILPETNHVAVVVGSSPIEKYWREEIAREVRPFADRVKFTWFDGLSFDEILERAAALPPRSAIFWELMIVDAGGVIHEEGSALSRLHAVANAPIFSYTDAFFGGEIVGGPHVPVLEHGRQVAEVAIRILNGEPPSDIKVPPTGFAAPKFDWREMQRWGISEAALPPGSSIYFRGLSAWERYWSVILLTFAVLLLQAGLIGWLIYEHRRRHLAEVQSRNAMADLTYMNRLAAAAQLSASLSHEVNQPLTGIVTRTSAALNWLRREKPDLEKVGAALQGIGEAAQRASGVVSSVRAMFKKEGGERTPVDLNDIVLMVLEIVRVDLQSAGINLRLNLQDDLPAVMGDRVQLQQVVLNLVMNAIEAMRSEQLRELQIRTEQSKPDLVHVLVGDTGSGIAASSLEQIFKPLFTTKSKGMGMGLAICRTIIGSHDGRIWVSPEPTHGAIFHIELPAKQ